MEHLKRKYVVKSVEHLADGFRLASLEIYNWGTFNRHIWTMSPNGGTSLLTGANGSGKSTLVDALLTLLVPNRQRSYNQASGAEKHRERDERTYILGAWSKQKDSTSNRARPEYLRGKDSYSVLLAVFRNEHLGQEVTLAQVLWIPDDSVHRLLVVAPSALNIATHFSMRNGMTMTDLRKQLKARGAEVYDDFSRYSHRFRQLVNLRSEKAFDLFNQVVSIKEIGGLNDFVRGHMLEKTDAMARVLQLRANFDNLTRAHDAIQLAQQQLDILDPLVKEADKYAEQQQRISEALRSAELVPLYIANCKKTLLETAITDAQFRLTEQTERKESLDRELEALNQQRIDLNVAIRNDSVGQQIEQIKQEQRLYKPQRDQKQKQATKYNGYARQIGLPEYRDETTFYDSIRLAKSLQEEAAEQLEAIKSERDERMHTATELKGICQALNEELTSLRQRKSQIPRGDIELRDQLVAALHIPEDQLPFIGELLRVRDSERRWEPAIERLLRNFGRQLLVPDQYYQAISGYVDRTNLRGRLVYHRISGPRTTRNSGRVDRSLLFGKLEVKSGTPFSEWLAAEIADTYDYLCCDTIEEFQNARRAVTLKGQVKHGLARHEKDDRSALGDRKLYVLGWNNAEKLAALEAELSRQSDALLASMRSVEALNDQQKSVDARLQLLYRLLDFDSFADIDWQTDERHLHTLQARLRELEASPSLASLRNQLAEVEAQHGTKQKERDIVGGVCANLGKQIGEYNRQRQACEHLLADQPGSASSALLKQIEKEHKERKLTLETMDKAEGDMRVFYTNRANSLQGLLNKTGENILRFMSLFSQTSSAIAQEVDISLGAIAHYRRFYERIKREDLPRHQKRFKELLNEKVITDIGSFKAGLEQQEREIEESINKLNGSLRSIDYTPLTYIQLSYEKASHQEVRDFRVALRACLPDVSQQRTPEANEASFQRIRALIQRFEQDERWTNKVTDVRNWLDFSAQELYREDNKLKNHYSDSAGRSGGQKTKLAYTILASAIAYQYGLDQDEVRGRSFRFIAVDEAFSRSDEMNARYALQLFKQLGLQLLVVTPLDKIHVIEPYISACHYVANNEDENDSKVYDLTIEEYFERKQAIQAGVVIDDYAR